MANDISSKVILGLDTNEFRRGIAKVDNSIKGISKQFQNLGGLIGASFAVRKIQDFSTEAIRLNGQLQKAAAGFARFGEEADLQTMRKQTRGLVTDLELMQQTVKGANLGIPFRDMGVLLEFAKRRADETGESIENLIGSIIEGVGRKSTRRLDNLGISADRLKEKVGGLSIEMASVAEVSRAMVDIASEELAKMGQPIDTAADKIDRLSVAWDNFMAKAGGPIAGEVANILDKSMQFLPTGETNGLGAGIRGYNQMVGTGGQFPSAPEGLRATQTQGIFSAFPMPSAPGPETLESLKAAVKILRDQFEVAAINTKEFIRLRSSIEAAEQKIKDLTDGVVPHTEAISLQSKEVKDLSFNYDRLGQVQEQNTFIADREAENIKRLTNYWKEYDVQVAAATLAGQEFGFILSSAFTASLMDGENFFENMKQALANYVKQMIAAAAATLVLAAALAIIFPKIGFNAAFNAAGGGMGLPFGIGENGAIRLKLSGDDLYGALGRNTTTSTRRGG